MCLLYLFCHKIEVSLNIKPNSNIKLKSKWDENRVYETLNRALPFHNCWQTGLVLQKITFSLVAERPMSVRLKKILYGRKAVDSTEHNKRIL